MYKNPEVNYERIADLQQSRRERAAMYNTTLAAEDMVMFHQNAKAENYCMVNDAGLGELYWNGCVRSAEDNVPSKRVTDLRFLCDKRDHSQLKLTVGKGEGCG